jgi:hypothetical protein
MLRAAALLLMIAATACSTPPPMKGMDPPLQAQTQEKQSKVYPLPLDAGLQDSPEGTLRVSSMGVTQLWVASGKPTRVLHLRMAVDNWTPAYWTVDTHDLRVRLGRYGESRPAYVNSGFKGKGSEFEIPAGTERVVDLYFPLPRNLESDVELPAFNFRWTMRRPTGNVSRVTAMQSMTAIPVGEVHIARRDYLPPDQGLGLGWGEHWWYDPAYTERSFAGAVDAPPLG